MKLARRVPGEGAQGGSFNMTRLLGGVVACAAAGALLVASAGAARADDDMRQIIREEIASYMAAQPAPAASSSSSDDGNVFKVYWKSGLRLDTKDKSVKLKIGGRLHIDANFYSDDDLEDNAGVDLQDGVEIRRVRLYNSGQIGKHVAYKAQFDFADGSVTFNDIHIDLVNLRDCLGCGMPNVRVGHFYEPFAREAQDSSKYYTFMEIAGSSETFGQGRNTGIMLYDSWLGDRVNYGVGYFLGATPGVDDDEGAGIWEEDGYGVSALVSWAPIWDCDCECRRLIIGASVSHRDELDEVRYRARPGLHVTDQRLIDTGVLPDCDSFTTFNGHLIWVNGPWSVQAEYFSSNVDAPGLGDPTFSGYYAFVSYWLTGECRSFQHGAIDRTKICCDFLDDDCCCKGGLELAARYDYVDLTDAAIVGGEQTVITVGLNWYWNANMRIMLNVLFGDVEDGRGVINESYTAVGLSFRVDW